ncbi:MAG: tyrosine-type recombinase/integrase [Oscillospiraceae bacterium]|nr:tyrosine-type recombinase/integrase [Oscillospiraceae bacterium]
MDYRDCPRVLRDFLSYHENIKGQSSKTVAEYYLDLRMFLRYIVLIRSELPYETDLNTISIKHVDLDFIKTITLEDIYDFLSYLSEDRIYHPETQHPGQGIDNAARARKLSAIKSFYKYLTVRTKQLEENPVADVEYPKLRRALPKYLTLGQAQALLSSVKGTHADRDLAILMIFLNCGVRISELAGLNYGDIYQDRLRVLGKGNKERTVYMGQACLEAIQKYNATLPESLQNDNKRPLFLSQKGGRMSTNAIHRLVKKHLAAAGLDETQFSAHKLRHTAATLMLSQGVDVKTVQEVLGHEHLNTTEIYTHIENTELKIAADANPISNFKVSHDGK